MLCYGAVQGIGCYKIVDQLEVAYGMKPTEPRPVGPCSGAQAPLEGYSELGH